MTGTHVEVLVEEPSMEAALRLIIPKIIGSLSFDVYPFQGKDDLLKKLPERLRGYANWLPPDYRIMVIVDRDDEDCDELKQRLEQAARDAGLTTRTQTGGPSYQIVNRLAIEELEAWYFGDWEAVRAAYPRVAATIPNSAKYRDPDAIKGGTWEAFERVLQRIEYFDSGLRKIEAARAIAPHMDPERNRSRSFQVLRAALLEMVPT
ncbi:MAG: DUF4276 family protein [SAR324 cluster bacterium]|nr:DUF4276 family protein [SAR324 cluster bacterium]